MSLSHDQLLAAAEAAKGLAPAERHQIRAVLADAEAGVDEDYELPELMWVDERSKAQLDTDRSHRQGAGLAQTFCREAMQAIADGKAQPSNAHTQTLEGVLSTVGDNLYSVASGSVDDAHRTQFVKDRTELGRALTAAGVYDETKADIRELVDTRARQAGKLGRGAVEREQRWKIRTAEILARRDDTIAQQHAARTARPRSTKTCATRVDRSAQTASPAPTGARTAARRHYAPGGGAVTDLVELLVIARIDTTTAVADLFSCQTYYDADTGTETGPGVEAMWETLTVAPAVPVCLDSLDQALTTSGYRRTSDWRKRVTAAGAIRYFAHATIAIPDLA
ncbi:hypothetical protein [Nocardia farcinica]|nr:hypothetical protein [Nocardia farcinica]